MRRLQKLHWVLHGLGWVWSRLWHLLYLWSHLWCLWHLWHMCLDDVGMLCLESLWCLRRQLHLIHVGGGRSLCTLLW